MSKERIKKLISLADQIKKGNYKVALPEEGDDDLFCLERSLVEIALIVEKKFNELKVISDITEKINAGIMLDEVLNHAYEIFHLIIPYNRIGFALLEEEGERLRSYWAKSDSDKIYIEKGYSARMKGDL